MQDPKTPANATPAGTQLEPSISPTAERENRSAIPEEGAEIAQADRIGLAEVIVEQTTQTLGFTERTVRYIKQEAREVKKAPVAFLVFTAVGILCGWFFSDIGDVIERESYEDRAGRDDDAYKGQARIIEGYRKDMGKLRDNIKGMLPEEAAKKLEQLPAKDWMAGAFSNLVEIINSRERFENERRAQPALVLAESEIIRTERGLIHANLIENKSDLDVHDIESWVIAVDKSAPTNLFLNVRTGAADPLLAGSRMRMTGDFVQLTNRHAPIVPLAIYHEVRYRVGKSPLIRTQVFLGVVIESRWQSLKEDQLIVNVMGREDRKTLEPFLKARMDILRQKHATPPSLTKKD
jgi:hypothetical protein